MTTGLFQLHKTLLIITLQIKERVHLHERKRAKKNLDK